MMKLIAPISVSLEITRNCNSNCLYCYNSMRTEDDISLKNFETILKILKRNHVFFVKLNGGEPLTHKKFKQLSKIFLKYDFNRSLITNSLLVTKYFNDINRTYHKIGFSLDGSRPINDKLRGKGHYDSVINNSKKIIVEKTLSVTVSKLNYKKIKELEKIAVENNFSAIVFIFYKSLGFGKKSNDVLSLTPNQLKIANLEILKLIKRNKVAINVHNDHVCSAGIELFNIYLNGDVSLCCFAPKIIGNILTEPFLNIKQKMLEARKRCVGKCCHQI